MSVPICEGILDLGTQPGDLSLMVDNLLSKAWLSRRSLRRMYDMYGTIVDPKPAVEGFAFSNKLIKAKAWLSRHSL